MKPLKPTCALVVMFAVSVHAQQATPRPAAPDIDAEANQTYQDIQRTLGLVPQYLRAYPKGAIGGAWQEMKGLQLNPDTALPNKQKELIGLAVAAQIPCHYCTYFHTEAAKLNGASQQELQEAVALAAATRHWSTYMNGIQVDPAAFRAELQRLFSKQPQPGTGGSGQPIITPQQALDDIQRTFGFVPSFLRQFPEQGIVGAWKQMKALDLSPSTALSAKDKALISLGVSAQVPCQFCVAFDTQSAQRAGAMQPEIHEAVAMAAITRQWSTVLNGSQIDEATFRREANQIMRRARQQQKRPATGGSGQ